MSKGDEQDANKQNMEEKSISDRCIKEIEMDIRLFFGIEPTNKSLKAIFNCAKELLGKEKCKGKIVGLFRRKKEILNLLKDSWDYIKPKLEEIKCKIGWELRDNRKFRSIMKHIRKQFQKKNMQNISQQCNSKILYF